MPDDNVQSAQQGTTDQSQNQTQNTNTQTQPGQQAANGTAPVAGQQQSQGQQPLNANAAQAAPYSDFQLPEGVEVAKETMDKFIPIAKSLNLSQEQAQSLVTFQGEYMAAQHKATVDAWSQMNDTWAQQAKEHKEFGGLQFDANNKLARKVIETFVPKEELEDFDKALMLTGMGNHPVLRSLLIRVGKRMGSDTMPQSGQGGGESGPRDLAKQMFPDMN